MEFLARLLARASGPLWRRLLLAGLGLWACLLAVGYARDAYDFYGGRYFHLTERYGLAVPALERFLSRRPGDQRACEAHLRLGRIYSRRFGRYLEARRHFETAAREFPRLVKCSAEAKAAIMDCPDYFPMESGRTWVYGDTASGGRNMRLTVELRRGQGGKSVLHSSLYAGKKLIVETLREYVKKDWAVWELADGKETMVLRYPFLAGSSWSVRQAGQTLAFRIEADNLRVKIKAGTFAGCIKVREKNPQTPGAWKYDYYAPGVGRVKTTVGAPGVENPNTELIRYRAP